MNNSYLQIASRRRSGGNFPSTGLVSYWNMDTDGSVPDSVGSNDGTITGATYTSSGKIDGAYSFDGNDYVTVTDSVDFHTTNFSMSFWVKAISIPASGSNHAQLIQKRWSPSYDVDDCFGFQVKDGVLDIYTYDGSYHSAGTVTIGFVGSWHHIVGTYDGTNVRFYYDGDLKKTTASGVDIANNSRNLVFGYGPDNALDGSMDEIGFWNRALTQTEITALYNSGDGLTY